MKYSQLLAAAVLATSVTALPTSLFSNEDSLLNLPGLASKVANGIEGWLGGKKGENGEDWFEGLKVERIEQGGIAYDTLTHPSHPSYRLRITSKSPSTSFAPIEHEPVEPSLCDPNVNQISGYLDILPTTVNAPAKHLFFWFFESRDSPKSDPLLLWLNGGPGCSSTTGLLFELGPCSIAKPEAGVYNTTYNEYSWTNKANVIFLDQPVGVGYSYEEDGNLGVNNSPVAAADVYAFLTLFVAKFSKYRELDLHISGESYAGTYLPNIAHTIYTNNKALSTSSSKPNKPTLPVLNLKSVLIGNGLTDAATQFASVPEYACDSDYAVYDDPESSECQSLRGKMQRCEGLARTCYRTNSRFTCVPANILCWSGFSQLQDLGLNLYDSRKKCDRSEDEDGPLCYRQMGWIEEYMNRPDVKKSLGVTDDTKFQSCNMDINKNFLLQGDAMHNTASLLPDLVNDGIRLLIYAGVQDMMCNYIGNEHWVSQLPTTYLTEFQSSNKTDFISGKETAGYVRSAGEGAGNVAFMAIYEAGHMVPYDQPQAALDMVTRWLANKPLANGK